MKLKGKRIAAWLSVLAMCFTLLAGCSTSKQDTTADITKIDDLAGKKVASLTGTVFGSALDKVVSGATHLYLNDLASQLEAVESGKASAALLDEPVARLAVAQHPDLAILDEKLGEDSYGFAFRKGDPLEEDFSRIVTRLSEDGTLKEMETKWFGADETVKILPELTYNSNFDGSAGTLRVGQNTEVVPMSYMDDDGKATGFEIELIMRAAYELNMNLELSPMAFDSVLFSLESGKSDMVGGCMSITEERKKTVDFSTTHYIGGMVAVVKKDAGSGFAPLTTARVGVMTGSTGEVIIAREYPKAAISSFDSFPDAVAALSGGKLDYVIGSYSSMANYAQHDAALVLMEEALSDNANAIAFKKGNTELVNEVNAIIDELEADGTLKEMEKRWLKTEDTPYEMVDIPKCDTGEVLRVAISADREPICFVKDGQYAGFDCELTERIAYAMGMQVEYQNMKFGGLLTSLQAGKSDMVISNLSYTEERALSVDFSRTYFDNPQTLLAKNPLKEEAVEPWYQSFAESFQKTFITESRYQLILQGLGTTLIISVLAVLFGTVLGFGICMMRRAKRAWFNLPAKIFIRLVQGIPIVVILMLLFYLVFTSPDTNPIMVAVIGFSINFAAYVSEMMRTGIDAVDKGQLEAASAIGFNKAQVFIKITLPQAARHVLPVFKGEFISMIKMTSVVGYIAIQDLTKMSDIIRSRTYEAFFPLIATAVIYFVISYLLTMLLTLIEVKIDPKHRKRIVKGVNTQ